jgi:hypothetical protein
LVRQRRQLLHRSGAELRQHNALAELTASEKVSAASVRKDRGWRFK